MSPGLTKRMIICSPWGVVFTTLSRPCKSTKKAVGLLPLPENGSPFRDPPRFGKADHIVEFDFAHGAENWQRPDKVAVRFQISAGAFSELRR